MVKRQAHAVKLPVRAGLVMMGVLVLAPLFSGTAQAFWPFVAGEPIAVEQQKSMEVDPNEAYVLEEAIRAMAHELYRNLREPDPEAGALAEGLLVSTFVDLKKLYRTSSFGRYVADQLMNDFQQMGYSVVEMRKANEVMVQERRGEYGLSRDPARIKAAQSAGTMLTGTYTLAPHHIMVNARILDNRSGVVLSSATAMFPRNYLSRTLLADTASAVTRRDEVVYMKKLEL